METIINDERGSQVLLEQNFLSKEVSSKLLEEMEGLEWSNHSIFIFGKWVKEPRSVAFLGDTGVSYTYSKQNLEAKNWTPQLLRLKNKINKEFNLDVNSVLINSYENGEQYMGWHCDNEKELGKSPSICSISLGASRDFLFRDKSDHTKKVKVVLENGDLLLMEGKTQEFWDHALPKRLKIKKRRVNLTFRQIL